MGAAKSLATNGCGGCYWFLFDEVASVLEITVQTKFKRYATITFRHEYGWFNSYFDLFYYTFLFIFKGQMTKRVTRLQVISTVYKDVYTKGIIDAVFHHVMPKFGM